MKGGFTLCLLFTLLVPGLALRLANQKVISLKHYQLDYQADQSTAVQAKACGVVSDELCQVCLQFADRAINILLNIILDDGIVSGCGELCGLLADRTDKLVGEVCDLLCVLVGFDVFVRELERIDIDPIYYCELLDVCAINDNGDARIIKDSVSPYSGPQGEKFMFEMIFTTTNGTGTGVVAIGIDTVDGIPISDGEITCKPPGTYRVGWTLDTTPNPDCETPPCEMWLPGTYNATMAVCYGECGSKHPHSRIYDEVQLFFEITG